MNRIASKITEVVRGLKLDLADKVVLTEAATGAYAVTPVIAALAGAKEVYAFTKPTRHGSVDEVKSQTVALLESFPEVKGRVKVITELEASIISSADIITNSGHLRPLDEQKLTHAREGIVVPLMYESWEWRDADLDLAFCKSRGITVAATNERHPAVDVFNYLGDMALKMIFDAGLTPYKNRFVLICNNDFGPFIARVISKVCDGLAVCDNASKKHKYKDLNIEWIGEFPNFNITGKFRNADAVIFTAYPFDKTWVGSGAVIDISNLREQAPRAVLLRYAGDIDELAARGRMPIHPDHVHSGHMGILPSAVGFDPIIRLQAGGLKAGELALKKEDSLDGIKLLDIL